MLARTLFCFPSCHVYWSVGSKWYNPFMPPQTMRDDSEREDVCKMLHSILCFLLLWKYLSEAFRRAGKASLIYYLHWSGKQTSEISQRPVEMCRMLLVMLPTEEKHLHCDLYMSYAPKRGKTAATWPSKHSDVIYVMHCCHMAHLHGT